MAWRSTAKDTVIATINNIYKSNVTVYMTDNAVIGQEPVVKIRFDTDHDALKFASNYTGVIRNGSSIILGKAKAEYIFKHMGIGLFGKTHPRSMYDALKYELYNKMSTTSTASKTSIPSEVTKNIDQIAIKGQFQIDNQNGRQTSGGNEKSLSEIEAAGVIPCHYMDNQVHMLLGFDPKQKQWKYFGGGKEPIDNNARSTAYRETVEETCKETNLRDCYIDTTVMRTGLENGNGLCIPKLNTSPKSMKWNNFYFIKLDIDTNKFKLSNHYEIDVKGIENDEVIKIKWFNLNELETLKDDTEQKYTKIPSGKIHPPIIGIIRDHIDKIKLIFSPIVIDQKIIKLLTSIDIIYTKKNYIDKLQTMYK